jgi:hypothetical protein
MRPTAPRLALLAFSALPFLAVPAGAGESKEDPRPHTDEQVAPALAKFESSVQSKDVGDRIQAVRVLGGWRHKKVLKELTRLYLKDPDLEIKAAAAKGIGNQAPFAKEAARTLATALEGWKKWATREDPEGADKTANEDEARVLSTALTALGDLGQKEVWEAVEDYIDHPHDGPAAALMLACGKWKEYRALPRILDWFGYYPDGLTWSGGSTSVDTGAEGNEDQKAAEAKWKRTFGARAKRARPAVYEVMVKALKDITGVEFKKPAELKAWMQENKALLKKHGV